jgi:hypothetical protein
MNEFSIITFFFFKKKKKINVESIKISYKSFNDQTVIEYKTNFYFIIYLFILTKNRTAIKEKKPLAIVTLQQKHLSTRGNSYV